MPRLGFGGTVLIAQLIDGIQTCAGEFRFWGARRDEAKGGPPPAQSRCRGSDARVLTDSGLTRREDLFAPIEIAEE